MIPINKPFLPPREEVDIYFQKIWNSNWLTNNGPLLNELESKIADRINNQNTLIVSNGTIALQLAIRSLGDGGEIITTPFSFIATTSAIVWQNFTPVFCDIESTTLNIDPRNIERHITKDTKAILATHVYGNPCDIFEIEAIAKRHDLLVIYDGAHAFDVDFEGQSIFNYGDVATCSLHATKFYHSTEGGLIVCNKKGLADRYTYMRNFGFDSHYEFADLGINAKNSEFHAAMGLANFKYLKAIKSKRKQLSDLYDDLLCELPIRKPIWNKDATKNYAYYPIIFESEEDLLNSEQILREQEIYSRRYFYPALNEGLPYVACNNETPNCKTLSRRVLCLPLYFDLTTDEVRHICKTLEGVFSKNYVLA